MYFNTLDILPKTKTTTMYTVQYMLYTNSSDFVSQEKARLK
jgi:hypothetical protein